MSYDGGLSIKIDNPELLSIMKKYRSMGMFDSDIVSVLGIEASSQKRTLAINYAYLDCAYSNGCPKSFDQLTSSLIKFLDDLLDGYVNKSLYSAFKEELKRSRSTIDNAYKYVDWVYYHPDSDSLEEERFVYESGESKYSYVGEQPAASVDSRFITGTQEFQALSEELQREKDAFHEQEWLKTSGQYLESDIEIKIAGSTFVFSGVYDEELEKHVLEAGGVVRKKVSGKTNYLVVDPAHAGESKVAHAIEQREKGNLIHVVHVNQLCAALGENACAPLSAGILHSNTNEPCPEAAAEELNENSGEFGLRHSLLPLDAVVWEQEKDDGDVITCVSLGEYEDADGDIRYHFTCQIDWQEVDSSEGFKPDEILDALAKGFAAEKQCQIFAQPKTIALNRATPVFEPSIGETLYIFGLVVLIQLSDWEVGSLVVVSRIPESDAGKNFTAYEFLHSIMSALVVNGRPLPMEQLTPAELKLKLEIPSEDFNEGKLFSDMLKDPLWKEPEKTSAHSDFKKLNDVVSINTCENKTVFLINNQWMFTLPPELDYETDAFFDWHEAAADLSGNIKPLVLKELRSAYSKQFCASVEPHFDITGAQHSAADCRNDDRFNGNQMNSQKIIVDGNDFYVDLTSENMLFLGTNCQIRIRGEKIDPFNITMVFTPDDQSHWDHIANYFREIATSITIASNLSKERSASPGDKSFYTPDASSSKCSLIPEEDLDLYHGELQKYTGSELRLILPSSIKMIGEGAFQRSDVESVVIPEGVTEIGPDAFYLCDSLEQIVLPSTLVKIGSCAFWKCEKLQEIILPEGLQKIEKHAFNGCKALRKVVIPDSCCFIGADAFTFCENLKDVYVPDSVQELGDDAFCTFNDDMVIHTSRGCAAEKLAKENGWTVDYNVSPSNNTTGAEIYDRRTSEGDYVLNAGTLEEYTGFEEHPDIPKSVIKIGKNAFFFSRLKSIVLHEGITEVGNSAFFHCVHLEHVLLPSTLAKIGSMAFHECEALQAIDLPKGLVEIGDDAFKYCKSLQKLVFPDGLKEISKGTCHFCHQLKHVSLPTSLTRIGSGAFVGCSTLQEIAFPESLQEIDGGAFCGCTNLKEILLPKGLGKISSNVFSGCKSLYEVTIPSSCVAIDEGAFASCENLQNIAIPPHVRFLGAGAFMKCYNLTAIHIPYGVETIEKSTFAHCTNLHEVSLPSSIKEIGRKAFEGCEALEELVLPDSVQKVFMSAFTGCKNLKRIYIPATTTKINKQGFSGCQQLTIYTEPGSYAEKFAKENGIPVENEALCITSPNGNSVTPTVVSNDTTSAPSVSSETHLFVCVDYNNREPYYTDFIFPSNYQITLKSEKSDWFDWTECNKSSYDSGDDVGIEGVVNFTCQVSSDGKIIGSLFDALMGIEKDDLFDEFRSGINHGMGNGSAIAVAMVVLSEKDDNWQCQWILFDFLSLQAQTGISDIVGTEEEAVTKAKIFTQSLSAALKDQLERIRKAAEETERKELERKQQEEAVIAERKRQEDAEFERKHQEALAAQRARHDELSHEISLQMQLISQNKGWFGKQAQIRKEAQKRLEVLQKQLVREFPNGKP